MHAADQPSDWIDISMPLHRDMVTWPGDPRFQIGEVASISRGDACNVSRLSLGAHTGTHVDAPAHYLADGATIDAAPMDALMGPGRVIDVDDATTITRADLEAHTPRRGERLLIKSRNSRIACNTSSFAADYTHLSREAAELLVETGVRTLGVDYLSVGAPSEDGDIVHRILLSAGIWLIEGLRLGDVTADCYELVCLPLWIAGGEAAPARAVLRPGHARNW